MCKVKLSILAFVLFQASIALSATTSNPNDQNDSPSDNVTAAASNQTDDFTGSELDKRLRLVPLTDAINDFGMKLISKLNNDKASPSKNIAFSPLSIGQVFSMIMSSARNQTLTELMSVFGYADQLETPDNVNDAFKILLDDYERAQLDENKRHIKLSLPSMALYSIDFNIKRSFRKNLKDNYKSDASKIDFKNPQAVTVINDFVKKNTNGLIPKLIEKLAPETKLALVNAFYFKGNWVDHFDKKFVQDRAFHNEDKSTKQVKTMFKRNEFDYFEDNDAQVVSLPYLGNASMTILLPQKNKSINDLIKNLNNSLIDYYRYQMKPMQVELYLPKFKIESSIDLKEPLIELGAKQVFSPEANLPGVTSFNNVFVSEAVHKGYVEVNEQGTEAAAATGVALQTRGISRNMRRMEVNHPFVYLIHDQLNNLVLFMGAVKKL